MGGTFDDSGTARPAADVVQGTHLVVLLECDRPLAGGARYALDGIERVLFGRGEQRHATRREEGGVKTLDVRLPGRSLSASHARLVRVGPSWAIEDLGSTNGIFVNGRRVERTVLSSRDLCELGHTFFRLNAMASRAADAVADIDHEPSPSTGSPLSAGAPVPSTLYPSLAAQFASLSRVARSDIPVLLLGDSGTGKELLARWVHAHADRSGEFVAVNCGAIPATLVESTLFGHTKGAFSGAVRSEPGLVRAAHGGTLFLDEIADLPKASQAALLRVLQEREVLPVGATRPVPVDVRLVAATHASLDDYVARGDFRRDLFARVAGFVLRLPPLRDRLDDFGILLASLLRELARDRAPEFVVSPDAGRALLAYDWPLNIRELQQCLSVCIALASDGKIELAHLPSHVARAAEERAKASEPRSGLSPRDEALRGELLTQLAKHRGNLANVARAMGKARMQIHRWCRRFGVDPRVFRTP